jgi:hypothetical protein
MRVGSLLGAGLLPVALLASGCGTAQHAGDRAAAPSPCPSEQAVVRRALDRSPLRADVTGDGKPDTVAAASDPAAAKPCRGLVAVRSDGVVYTAHLIPGAVPIKGIRARVVAVPHLGHHSGAAIVVDTGAAVDAVLAQLFTFSDGRLVAVKVPGERDGSFVVAGGGLMFPHAAGCTSDGRLVVSGALQTPDGHRFRVVRHSYELDQAGRRLAALPVQRATVSLSRLDSRFPEFAGARWQACTDRPV